MFRLIDLFFATLVLVVGAPIMVLIASVLYIYSGSPFFLQTRAGKNGKAFTLIKFRTMSIGTDSVATHLVSNSAVTPIGSFLRKYKFDELPQLWNVLVGDMSFVGPRPCLLTQLELVELRQKNGIFAVKPGITGLAQISGIDMSNPSLLVKTEVEMLKNYSLKNYFKFIFLTVAGKGFGDHVNSK